jgi:hypothetical protein
MKIMEFDKVIDGFISNIRSFPIFKICVFNEFLGAS